MPGSHGGGHSGGSHGSHGSFSSSGSTHHYSPNKPFPGARRYYYVNRFGVRQTFYSSLTPKVRPLSKVIAPYILAFAIIIFISIFFAVAEIIPHKMNSKCEVSKYIYDYAEVIEEKDKLEDLLEEFYVKTNVQPVVLTEKLSTFKAEYVCYSDVDFEKFAYNRYLDLFDDEGHWLFVYLHDSEDDDNNHWIDMAGDYTDCVVTETLFDNLQYRIQEKFFYDDKTFEESFEYAFEYTIDEALTFDKTKIEYAMGGSIFALVFLMVTILGLKESIKENNQMKEYCEYRDKNNEGKDLYEEVDPSTYSNDKDYKTDEYGNKIE